MLNPMRFTLAQVLMMIGENEEASICDEINGVVLNVRHKGDKLALWTRTTNDKELVMSIGWV